MKDLANLPIYHSIIALQLGGSQMLTISKTGKNLQESAHWLQSQATASVEDPPTERSMIGRLFHRSEAAFTSSKVKSAQVERLTLNSLRAHWEQMQSAAHHYHTFQRSTWPKAEYRRNCEKLEQWCACFYLPSRASSAWRAVRSALVARSLSEQHHQSLEEISELAALVTIELRTCVRPPLNAFAEWERSQELSARAERDLRRWIADLEHYRSVLDALTMHVALREIARRVIGEKKLGPQDFPLVHAHTWGTLEHNLEQRGLHLLAQPLPAFRRHYHEVLQCSRLERAEQSSCLNMVRDALEGDSLGKDLSLFPLLNEAQEGEETWALIAKSQPGTLLRILRDWPKLEQLAHLPQIVEIDPLGRFLLFRPTLRERGEILTREAETPFDAREGERVSRRSLARFADFFSRLRQQNLGLDTHILPLRDTALGQISWVFPPPLIPFCFEGAQRMMRQIVPEGPDLAQLAEQSGLSECREAQECQHAVRCAIDGQPYDWQSRDFPWTWSTEWIAGIEELYFEVFETRGQIARQARSLFAHEVHGHFAGSELMGRFNRLVRIAHAQAGFGLTLNRGAFPPLFQASVDQSVVIAQNSARALPSLPMAPYQLSLLQQ